LIASLAAVVLLSLNCSTCKAQATGESVLISIEDFKIPSQNGTIRFTANSTYEDAFLEQDSWRFTNLQFTNFTQQPKLNLTASAKNCDVEITSYRYVTSNTSLGNIRLRYTVAGQGTQTFNFDTVPKDGYWNVIIDGVYVGQKDGWTVSDNKTITVTGSASHSNVSIIYYIYPASFVNLSNQSFLEKNSVAIATALALTVTVIIAVIAKKKSTKLETDYSPIKRKAKGKEKQ
jgi:hypothetical protein